MAEPELEGEPEAAAEAGVTPEPEFTAEPTPEAEAVPAPEADEALAGGRVPVGEPAPDDSGVLFDVPRAAPPAAEPEPAPVMSEAELRGAVEAILLIVDEPATEITLAQVLDQPVDRIRGVLEDIARQYTQLGLGFDLRRVAGGWRLYTRAEFAPYVEKFVLDGQQIRLTQAALETLAVVAYKQPVTRSRISAIRGVNCDGVVRTLVTRGLIEETGSEPESGAFLYRTTSLFLEKLGLDSVDQLPPLAPFLPDDIDEIADAQR
ncbi:SMC-Scp complex subunit ScpB [Dactylosporangium sp. NPDC005555]|uniref:SMC-Scp complex subunit ScpB n=1 Tax=Dactylosporangium sp. NPDC005555 TaxID=3154889 RepID=UPI0033B8BE32